MISDSRSDWTDRTDHFCHELIPHDVEEPQEAEAEVVDRVLQAHRRLKESKSVEQNNNCQKEQKEEQVKGQGEKQSKEAADKGKVNFESSDYYSSGNEM